MTPNHQEAPVATNKQYLDVFESAKAYVALVGAIASALLGVFASDTPVGQVLTVIAVVATAVATYKVPNAGGDFGAGDFEEPDTFHDGHAGV